MEDYGQIKINQYRTCMIIPFSYDSSFFGQMLQEKEEDYKEENKKKPSTAGIAIRSLSLLDIGRFSMTTLPALCNESVINEKAKTISNFNKASGIFFRE